MADSSHDDPGDLARALSASEARFAALIENLPFDAWMIDLSGRYVLQNSRCRELYGDVIGLRPEDVTDNPDTLALWQDNNRRAFAGETVRGEVEFMVGGKRRHFYNVIAPVVVEGINLGILGLNLDITGRKQTEEELRRRNEELRQANLELERLSRSKDQLTAMISHELRTPLVTGLGYIEMLLEGTLGPISDTIHSRLTIAQRNLRRLAQLIDGVLRYQRLVAAGFDPASLQTTDFDLGALATELLEERSTGRGTDPELVLDERLPRVSGDRELIRMVLANLLDNATAHAGPQAKTRLVIRGGLEQVWVSVEDNGAGIPAEILDTALDPFIRGDEAQGGSGLGLAIVRAILRSHGTEPQLESAPGRGTRISFRLRSAD